MIITSTWASISLIGLSIGVLAIDSGILTAGSGSISLGFISIGDIEIHKPEIFVVIIVSVLLLLLTMHVLEQTKQCLILYKEGYQENETLCNELKSFLISHVGHDKVGCPTGNLSPGWKKKPIPIGIYIKADGNQTPNLNYTIPDKTHYGCKLTGICNMIISRSFFVLAGGFAIVLLALWQAIT